MIFLIGGRLRKNLQFFYKDELLEIFSNFTYLGIHFTTGGSFTSSFETLSGQALNATYKLNVCMLKYPTMSVKCKLDICDKLVLPTLHYGSEVWCLNESPMLERNHLHFCKRILDVKIQTKNNFVYDELGRTSLRTIRAVNVVRYWLKIVK